MIIFLQQKSLNTTASAANLNNYNKMNGSFDSIEKNPSAFTSMDNTSYEYFEAQTPRTGVSQASSMFDGEFSRHPMGRPRPRPENGIHGLPIIPPQAPHRLNVQADVLQRPSFDLTYQNQNFRETPSMPSIPPNEFWGGGPSSSSNQNGSAHKLKNTNANDFPRTHSMATTFPLHNESNSTDQLTDIEQGSPPSFHHPLSVHPTTNNHQYRSYDQLEVDKNRNRIGRGDEYVPNIFPDHSTSSHRQSMPPTAFNLNNEVITPSQMSHKHLPKPPTKPRSGPSAKRPLPLSDSSTEDVDEQSPEMMSFEDKNQSGNRKGRIIETSLDDLEVDYELEETIRPVSTYLETNVDNDNESMMMPPMRAAKSQYMPPTTSSPSSSSRAHQAPSDDFKALSSRSKSMPLETEM
jgi:hypothetical protein